MVTYTDIFYIIINCNKAYHLRINNSRKIILTAKSKGNFKLILSIRPSTPAVGVTGTGEASVWLSFFNKNRFSGEKIVYFSLYDVPFFL